MSPHGYSLYTHGCRCETCRTAKAEYMRERRAAARANAGVADIERHGTRYGYEEAGCRCGECISARAASDRKYWPRRSARLDAKRIRQAATS